MNIATLIRKHAKKCPHQRAVIFPVGYDVGGRRAYAHYTFKQLEQASDLLAKKFSHDGIQKGSKVLLFVRPSLEFSLVTFSLFKIGAVVIFIDPGMGRKNLFECIAKVAPDVLIAEPIVHLLAMLACKKLGAFKKCYSTARFHFGRIRSLLKMLIKSENFVEPFPIEPVSEEDLAAIVFTSGGTGKPKGVLYQHGVFHRQVELLKSMFRYSENDIDLACFPLFSMTSMAMGVTSCLPDMNAAEPAKASPAKLLQNIQDQGVTTAAGSPAIWEKVLAYCQEKKIELSSLRALIMFGAPVAPRLIEGFAPLLPHGQVYTPYGATECLPVSLVSSGELLAFGIHKSRLGWGTLVGKGVEGTEIKIIEASEKPILNLNQAKEIAKFCVGEVIVKGQQATKGYFDHMRADQLSKIVDAEGGFWHRMGDIGYLDDQDNLWFCGRKDHLVSGATEDWYSVPCEAIFNKHPKVRRSALIGLVMANQEHNPCIVIERFDRQTSLSIKERNQFRSELLALAAPFAHTKNIETFFLFENFPVDRRHNIKIDRLMLRDYFSSRTQENL